MNETIEKTIVFFGLITFLVLIIFTILYFYQSGTRIETENKLEGIKKYCYDEIQYNYSKNNTIFIETVEEMHDRITKMREKEPNLTINVIEIDRYLKNGTTFVMYEIEKKIPLNVTICGWYENGTKHVETIIH